MNRIEELTLELLDDSISEAGFSELRSMINSDPAAADDCVALLRTEATLRSLRRIDVASQTVATIGETLDRVTVAGVIHRIENSPPRPKPARFRSRPWHWWTAGAAAAVIAISILPVWRGHSARVTLVSVEGKVWIESPNGRKVSAKSGDTVFSDQRLIVEGGAKTSVDWKSQQASIILQDDTTVRWPDKDRCTIEEGDCLVEVRDRKGHPPLWFETRRAAAKITGTRFSLHDDEDATRLLVKEGSVSFASQQSTAEVKGGQFAVAAPGTTTAARTWPGDGNGIGLLGLYAPFRDLKRFTHERLDPEVRFDWKKGSPTDPRVIHTEHFGVRWIGYVEPRFSEDYTFYVRLDDGARLWLDGKLILDGWSSINGAKVVSSPVRLSAGNRHAIQLDYCERTRSAHVALYWVSASQPREVIPKSQLHPPDFPNLPPSGELSPSIPRPPFPPSR